MGRCTDMNQGDVYDLVKRSDGTVVDSLFLGVGCRALITRNELSIEHEKLQNGERVTSDAVLREIISEMMSKN